MTPSKRLAGRRALVTGASRGIGAATAQRLAAEGADVAVTARTAERHSTLAGSLHETTERIRAGGGNAVAIVADLADAEERSTIVPRAVEALAGPIDILVNNAAAAIYQPLLDFPLKRRHLTFEINVHAPMDLAQAVLPAMVAHGAGWIVNVSSATSRPAEPPFDAGRLGSTTGVYGASKAALNRMTNALAVEFASAGIRINTVEPRSAVMSEGAEVLIGSLPPDQVESMEQMVEAILALCDCPPERTGRSDVSLDLLQELSLHVHGLDGAPLPSSPHRRVDGVRS
jgi:citronellol/citronellal dehydrogenase